MEIPYRKIFIYLLTFAAYAYSGMGSSMLKNIKDAVLSAETVFGDMFRNFITVAEKFRCLHDIFDAAVEEECIFTCPNGQFYSTLEHLIYNKKQCFTGHSLRKIIGEEFNEQGKVYLMLYCRWCLFAGQKPVRNRNHTPKSNGCGSLGFDISSEYLPLEQMTKCCDAHDICYDTCNSGKEVCDLDFKRCLYNYCDTYRSLNVAADTITKGCKAAAKLLFTGTLTLGCKSYLDAQKKACYCAPSKNKNKKYTTGDGDL